MALDLEAGQVDMCDGDNHGSCEHGPHDSPEIGVHYSLYTKIDLENVQCLNECSENSGRHVFKAWENRLDFDKVGRFLICRTTYNEITIVHLQYMPLPKKNRKLILILQTLCSYS